MERASKPFSWGKMIKIIFKFFFSILIVFSILLAARNVLVKFILENGVKSFTGLSLTIEDVHIGLKEPTVSIENFKLMNPAKFEDPLMIDISRIYLRYDTQGFLKGNSHFYEVDLFLKEFLVVKNKEGELNLDTLKGLRPAPREKTNKEGEKKKKSAFLIDQLNLKIERVIYKDYSQGKGEIKEFNVNIDEKFFNVRDPRTLVRLIVVKALSKTTIDKLINLNLKDIQEIITGSFFSISEGILNSTADVFKKTTTGLTDLLKKPFQSRDEK